MKKFGKNFIKNILLVKFKKIKANKLKCECSKKYKNQNKFKQKLIFLIKQNKSTKFQRFNQNFLQNLKQLLSLIK